MIDDAKETWVFPCVYDTDDLGSKHTDLFGLTGAKKKNVQ